MNINAVFIVCFLSSAVCAMERKPVLGVVNQSSDSAMRDVLSDIGMRARDCDDAMHIDAPPARRRRIGASGAGDGSLSNNLLMELQNLTLSYCAYRIDTWRMREKTQECFAQALRESNLAVLSALLAAPGIFEPLIEKAQVEQLWRLIPATRGTPEQESLAYAVGVWLNRKSANPSYPQWADVG